MLKLSCRILSGFRRLFELYCMYRRILLCHNGPDESDGNLCCWNVFTEFSNGLLIVCRRDFFHNFVIKLCNYFESD